MRLHRPAAAVRGESLPARVPRHAICSCPGYRSGFAASTAAAIGSEILQGAEEMRLGDRVHEQTGRSRGTGRAALAGLVVLAATCMQLPQAEPTRDTPTDAGPTSVDRRIAAGVRHVLSASDQVDVHGLEVAVDGGVVTLHGTVASAAEKHLAARYARDVPGVPGVVNALVVEPGLRLVPDRRPQTGD